MATAVRRCSRIAAVTAFTCRYHSCHTIRAVIDTEQLLADLTEPQREAVTHVDGPLLIVAGAGAARRA